MSFLNDPALDPFAPPRPAPRPDGADPAVGIGAGGGNVNLAAPVPFLISERGQMVSHLWVAGGRIFDPYTRGINQASGWAEVGAVPKVAPAVPPGCDGRRVVEGLGPFGAGIRLDLGVAGIDALDFPSQSAWTVCAVWRSAGTDGYVASDGAVTERGWAVLETAGSVFLDTIGDALSLRRFTFAGGTADLLTVACLGSDGTSRFGKVNAAATQTSTASAQDYSPNLIRNARIGVRSDGSVFETGTLYEFWASQIPASAALLDAIAAEVKGRLGVTAW